MSKLMPSILLLAIIAALTVLVVAGKLDAAYLMSVITGIVGWLIPAPKKDSP